MSIKERFKYLTILFIAICLISCGGGDDDGGTPPPDSTPPPVDTNPPDNNDPNPPSEGYESATSYAGMTMVWSDEFDGTSLNSDDWNLQTGDHGWGNNEWQNYTQSATSMEDGILTIKANKDGDNYTSARINTQGKVTFKYGRIDVRAALPEGQGVWPAIWMLGESFATDGWPFCGEIDIMEMIGGQGRENTVHGTVHWDSNGHASYGGHTTLNSGTFHDKFHVFSIVWDADKIEWYLDDVQYHVIDITPADLSEFHAEFHFLMNIAVGGNWPGYPDASTTFPQYMYVDYIRVFQED